MGIFDKLKRELKLNTSQIEKLQHNASNMYSHITGQLNELKNNIKTESEKITKPIKNEQNDNYIDTTCKTENIRKLPDEAIEIINECAKNDVSLYLNLFSDTKYAIMSTTNVDTFFSRYELLEIHFHNLIENLKKHSELSSVDYFKMFSVSTLHQNMLEIIENKEENITQLIHRWYHKVIEDASTLKTEKGRKNRINHCFEEMRSFSNRFSAENIELLEKLEQQAINSI